MSFFRENCKDEIGREVEWAILELKAKWVLGLMIKHTALPTIRRPKNIVALWKDARFFIIESQLGVFNESSEMEQTREHCTSLSRSEIEGAECGVMKYWWNHSGLICCPLNQYLIASGLLGTINRIFLMMSILVREHFCPWYIKGQQSLLFELRYAGRVDPEQN